MTIKYLRDLDLKSKRVLIREDLNVPQDEQGNITSDARIIAALPTIQYALQHGAAVILMSHLGRPEEGKFDTKYSLAPIAKRLSELLGQEVPLISLDAAASPTLTLPHSASQNKGGNEDPVPSLACGGRLGWGKVVLLENVRFNKGENKDDDALAKKLAGLCDIFVMDAFATAHRAQASTHGVAKFAPIAVAGPLLQAELEAIGKVLKNPAHPLIAIVGGSKVSSKLTVLKNLLPVVDQLIVGGGIANTFIAAANYAVGKSLYEADLVPEAKRLIVEAQKLGVAIPIPSDVVVAKTFAADSAAEIKSVEAIAPDDIILDIGPQTAIYYRSLLQNAGTILWNGPVGVFEFPAFAEGTRMLTEAIADSRAFTVAGGGDTLAAIDKYRVADKISYISTGGGAFLELLEGKKLPSVIILDK
jgi:phosphoglycerate kinase